jgi:hypothetical protein
MLLRVTKICCARLEALQISQICDLPVATFIIPMPVEKGQAGGGVELLTMMVPLPLAKIPATQVVPQDAKAWHANTTTALRNKFRILRGRHRMGLLQTAFPTMRGWKFCGRFYAREGFGTRREIANIANHTWPDGWRTVSMKRGFMRLTAKERVLCWPRIDPCGRKSKLQNNSRQRAKVSERSSLASKRSSLRRAVL